MDITKDSDQRCRSVIFGGIAYVAINKSVQSTLKTYQPWNYKKVTMYFEDSLASSNLERILGGEDNTKSLQITSALALIETAASNIGEKLYVANRSMMMPLPVFPMYEREVERTYISYIFIESPKLNGLFDRFTLDIEEIEGGIRVLCFGDFNTPIHYRPCYSNIEKVSIFESSIIENMIAV